MGSNPQHVTIIGVGLLGGSAALAIRAHWPDVHVAGVGRRQSSLDAATATNVIDSAHLDPLEPVSRSDLVLLATPVGAFEKHLRAIKPALRRGAMVTDVGSTKAGVVCMAERVLGWGGPFIGSHPMAGSEQKGVCAARGDLFEGATCVITPTAHTPPRLVKRAEELWASMGMHTVQLRPAAHDKAVARVSHLPHALASLLMRLPRKADLGVSATGFRDATRLASGDPEMWRDIFLTNRSAVLASLDEFAAELATFRALVNAADGPGMEKYLATAKKRRDETIARRFLDRRVAME